MINNMIKLQTYPRIKGNDDYFQDTFLTEFTITEENLIELLQTEDWEMTLEEFLEIWDWDTALFIYADALNCGYIESEKVVKREKIDLSSVIK